VFARKVDAIDGANTRFAPTGVFGNTKKNLRRGAEIKASSIEIPLGLLSN